jgi:diketogulonate reductase-like aldo/keto reductase
MPYNPSAPLDVQIKTSVASSLANLRKEDEPEEGSYIDCMLLHSPLPTIEQTLEAWTLLESYVPRQIRTLGISNVTLPVLQAIYDNSEVKPSVVQNRFYPQTRYDVPIRNFCREYQIIYQSFWTLTGNPALLKSEPVVQLAQAVGVGLPVALYALVMNSGIEVLNGTTSQEHMREDLEGIMKVQEWAARNSHDWTSTTNMFRELTGDTRQ